MLGKETRLDRHSSHFCIVSTLALFTLTPTAIPPSHQPTYHPVLHTLTYHHQLLKMCHSYNVQQLSMCFVLMWWYCNTVTVCQFLFWFMSQCDTLYFLFTFFSGLCSVSRPQQCPHSAACFVDSGPQLPIWHQNPINCIPMYILNPADECIHLQSQLCSCAFCLIYILNIRRSRW